MRLSCDHLCLNGRDIKKNNLWVLDSSQSPHKLFVCYYIKLKKKLFYSVEFAPRHG